MNNANRIAAVSFNVTGSADWDTEHVRLTEAEIANHPLQDEFGNDKARIVALWTDAEYEAKWGKKFEEPAPAPWNNAITIKLSKNQVIVVGSPSLSLTPDSALAAVHKYEDAAKYFGSVKKRSLASAAQNLADEIREKFEIGYAESRRSSTTFVIG